MQNFSARNQVSDFWGWKPLNLEVQRGLSRHMETHYISTFLVVTQTPTVTLECVNCTVYKRYLDGKKYDNM